jgi:F-type H+-transporting ATPase subunit epsilon
MADTVQFDLVSPERLLTSVQAREVQIPGAEGDLTAMPQHSPTITTLRPGVLRATGPEGVVEYVVTGGFAEISTDGVTVLAERAMARNDVSQDDFDSMVQEAAEAVAVIVLQAVTPTLPGGDSGTGGSGQPPQDDDTQPPPQTQNDNLSTEAGTGGE